MKQTTKLVGISLKLLVLFLLISANIELDAQIMHGLYEKGKDKTIDTMGIENAMKIAKETEGKLETPIIPSEYILGPNDIFQISILTSEPHEFEAIISPEGLLMMSEIGAVDLKNKTLEEAYPLIIDKIKRIHNTDEIYVALKDVRQFKVTVSGAVQRTSMVNAYAVDRVSEAIEKAGGLDPDASMRKIVLLRDGGKQRIIVDLLKFYKLGDKSSNPTLDGGDQIIVPTSSESESILISGEVNKPNLFEFSEGDSLSTLIKFGGGFLISSKLDSVEIARYDQSSNKLVRFIVDLRAWRDQLYTNSKLPNDFKLQPGDRVFVRKFSNWVNNNYAVILGEVKYPGHYPINEKTDRLSDLINRAGGLTEVASDEAALLIRQEEMNIVDEELERLRTFPTTDMSESERRYFQTRIRERKGLMAIDFNKAMKVYDSQDNIFLRDQDSILVPQKKTFINVQGRVNKPGLISYVPGLTYLDYIELAGGYGFRSDRGETQVTKSRGEIFDANSFDYVLEPGDVILVPPEDEGMTFYEAMIETISVLAQLASIAAVIAIFFINR